MSLSLTCSRQRNCRSHSLRLRHVLPLLYSPMQTCKSGSAVCAAYLQAPSIIWSTYFRKKLEFNFFVKKLDFNFFKTFCGHLHNTLSSPYRLYPTRLDCLVAGAAARPVDSDGQCQVPPSLPLCSAEITPGLSIRNLVQSFFNS